MAFAYEDLKAATFHNNPSFVSEWLHRTCAGEKENRDEHQKWMGSLLGLAAYQHSVDVVLCIIDHIGSLDDCKDILNYADTDGKAPLHHAAEGSKRTDMNQVAKARDLLNIIGYLFKNGADPTFKSKAGMTPKVIAAMHKFKIGSALFEILENVWLKKAVSGKADSNEEICWHKELLQWAVENAYEEIVICILRMNLVELVDPDQPCTTMIQPCQQIVNQDSNTMEFLLRTTEELYASSFIHTAANLGNVNMLKAFIICSGQSLNVAINRRWKLMLQNVVPNEESQSGQTPLSLALSHPSYRDIITALAELQVGNKSITQIDLSNSMTEFLPKELFSFHSIINLNIRKNYLNQLPFAQLASNLRPGQLSDLNVSSNQLSNLPVEIFYLPNLKYLNASDNPLTSLPDIWWLSKSLIKLNVSNTQLTELCSWKDADQNYFKKHGRLASNTSNTSPMLLHRSDSLDRRSCLLKEINVSFSRLSSFPRYLACYFPNLAKLNVSNNNITSCCAVNEMPGFLEELDISNNKLQSEDCAVFSLLSNTNCCYLNTEVESSLKCTHMRHTKLLKLRVLNLSNNEKLQKITLHVPTTATDSLKRDFLYFPKLAKLVISNCGLLQAPEFLDKMDRIYHLDISKNHDMKIPHEIHNLSDLMTFVYNDLKDPIAADLDKFSTVKEQLMFLMQKDATCAPSMKLMFVGLSGRGKTTLLNSLRFAGKVKTKPITIKERLNSGSSMEFSEEIQSTIGIDLELWCYAKDMDTEDRGRSGNSDVAIAFYAWDFAGQEEYSAAHQCFVTDNSLYVLCWRTCDKIEGILELKDWLLTIKARAKSAAVVIVGTHIDKIKGFGARSTASFVKSIKDMYSNEHEYPPIKAIKFVSCETQFEGTIKNLRDTLYDIASETKLSLGSRRYEQKLMDMMIPNKYLKLQTKIIAEGAGFRLHKERRGPPILSWKEMLEIGGDCGFEEDELAVAIKYLKNQGILMHFDSLALQDYYFLDPQWLCDMFAHVISTEYNYTFVNQGGKGDRQALEASLREKFCISPRFMEPLIMLLNKFELAIPLNQTTFLIPSLLQNEEVPDVVNRVYGFSHNRSHTIDHAYKTSNQSEDSISSFNSLIPNRMRAGTAYLPSVIAHHRVDKQITLFPKGTCFRRVFIADHIPANFWPRLIARFLSSAHTFHAIICENCSPNIQCQDLVQIGYATIGALKCGWSYGKNYITLCLGEDILLCVNALYSYDNNNSAKQRKKESTSKVEKVRIYYSNEDFTLVNIHNGFEVTIPDYSVSSQSTPNEPEHNSELMSAQVLSRVLEIIDEVFRDWFDGLSDRGIYSDKYLTHFVPCSFCYDGKKLPDTCTVSFKFVKRKIAVGLSIKYCLLQARTSDHINCPDCGELLFKDHAPDLVFEDKKFQKIDLRQLKISSHSLGEGGFGAVFKAVLLTDPPQDVALKCFTGGLSEAKTITLEDLSQTYADVRMEFNKLVSIDHQYIVKCIGFSVISMAFILELASHGSLKTVMNNYKSSGYHLCPNSLIDTIKQVSVALNYLHTEKMIAHYDIKPANILVFRYPPAGHNCFNKSDSDFLCTSCKADHNDRVEVKLADLGVSAFVGPGGFRRRPATPGHTAPEAIKYGGKESLMEKVDIFSLGITLFELMTLRFLPPAEMNPFDFDSDIRDGIRPPFYEEDPNYPAILKELIFKCWAQDYAARPSAEEIVSILKSADCLKLSNVLDTELPYSAVSAALVVGVDDKQSLWLAHSIDDQHKVTVYELSEGLSSTSFSKSKSFDVNGSVQIMCQAGMQVWMGFENGSLGAVNAQSFSTENQMRDLETRDGLIQIVNLSDCNDSTTLALAYKSGVVVLIKSYHKFPQGIELKSFGLDVLSKLQDELTTVKLTSSQLCATEAYKSRVWCGCNDGAIEVISLSDDTFKVQLFNAHDSSPDIPQDTSIIQLRFSAIATPHMMYALHSCGHVISCWSVSEQPVLNTVIKLTQLISSPVNMIIPIENKLILADVSGKVHELNVNHTMKEKYLSCKQLPSYHQSNTMIQLFCLHGKMTPQGILFSIGNSSPDKRSDYVNVLDILCPSSLPCIVLLGLRAGCNFFQAESTVSSSLYFTTWVFPNTTAK